MATMRAVQVPRPNGPFEIVERPIPEPGTGSVRIKVQACGICHSDSLTKEGHFPGVTYPRVPGHEIAGVIDAVGSEVPQWKVGQRVGVGWLGSYCGHCESCRRGIFITCANQRVTGITMDGGYQEYVLVPFEGLALIPEEIKPIDAAPLMCAGITTFNSLFRLGFAIYLIEALCDVALNLIFYVLLRPVHKNLALLAVFFGLMSTALYAVAELFYFAASIILRGGDALKAFSPDQLNALALLSLKVFGTGAGLFMVFYGVASVLRGYLIFRSGYLPRFLGVLLVLAGLGFITKNFALVLAPAYAWDALLLPMFLAAVSLMVWFLAKGVDIPKWRARSATFEGLTSE